ncbi:hypothetical protein RIF29_24715 [Crotalaria pallida]|uniref:Uncharacterized protein n=1 Tax=Crotalaria pallida TaxID=3830 RepID=A0AAN9HYP5_CROPI
MGRGTIRFAIRVRVRASRTQHKAISQSFSFSFNCETTPTPVLLSFPHSRSDAPSLLFTPDFGSSMLVNQFASHNELGRKRPVNRDERTISCYRLELCYSHATWFLLQEEKSVRNKNPAYLPLGMIIKVKPRAKKAKVDEGSAKEVSKAGTTAENDKRKSLEPVQPLNGEADKSREVVLTVMHFHTYIQDGGNHHVHVAVKA